MSTLSCSIPTLDAVTNEMIETTEAGAEQVILASNIVQAKVTTSGGVTEGHPVIVRPATDWDMPNPQSQSPHQDQAVENATMPNVS